MGLKLVELISTPAHLTPASYGQFSSVFGPFFECLVWFQVLLSRQGLEQVLWLGFAGWKSLPHSMQVRGESFLFFFGFSFLDLAAMRLFASFRQAGEQYFFRR